MTEEKIYFPEVVGKVVSELYINDDPEYGKEVIVRFSDDTQLAIAVGVRQTIDARYFIDGEPDIPISHKQTD